MAHNVVIATMNSNIISYIAVIKFFDHKALLPFLTAKTIRKKCLAAKMHKALFWLIWCYLQLDIWTWADYLYQRWLALPFYLCNVLCLLCSQILNSRMPLLHAYRSLAKVLISSISLSVVPVGVKRFVYISAADFGVVNYLLQGYYEGKVLRWVWNAFHSSIY